MSAEQNAELFRRFIEEGFNQRNLSVIDEAIAPDFVEHEELPPGIAPGREGVRQFFGTLISAFPDFKFTIDDVIAQGDKVVVRSTWTGTQQGEFLGIPPTGRGISFGVIDIVRIAGGQAVEHWGQMDSMRMMQQLGVIPEPGAGEG
jgi:predicted ester cyclase